MIASPLTLTERLTRKFNDSPSVFGFLGLTVGALTLGLRSLASGDKRQSQLMMRFRVFFQFCAYRGCRFFRAQPRVLHADDDDAARTHADSLSPTPRLRDGFAGLYLPRESEEGRRRARCGCFIRRERLAARRRVVVPGSSRSGTERPRRRAPIGGSPLARSADLRSTPLSLNLEMPNRCAFAFSEVEFRRYRSRCRGRLHPRERCLFGEERRRHSQPFERDGAEAERVVAERRAEVERADSATRQ